MRAAGEDRASCDKCVDGFDEVVFFGCDQAALRTLLSVRPSVCLSVCPSHLFDYVPVIVSSWLLGDNVFTLCVCLFVCVCVVVYVCHDVCPDELTMKDWCHTNNILQVHCWGCLVVQVMFHALMTSLMTSQDHKVGQILKLIYLRQY